MPPAAEGDGSAGAGRGGGMLARLAENSLASVRDGVYDDVPPGRPCCGGGRGGGAVSRAVAAAASRGLAPVIAEVKFASPSLGRIRQGRDPVEVARAMAAGGACAVSVLTQPRLFNGSPSALAAVRAALPDTPILMKDVVVDRRQVDAAGRLGADCVLLMQSLLGGNGGNGLPRMAELVSHAHSLGLEVLAEAHTAAELEAAASASDADLLGINNRDLDTLEVDLGTTGSILSGLGGAAGGAAGLARGRPIVSESGISSPADVALLRAAGADAFLVGTGVMSAGANVEKAVAGLVGAA